MRRPIRPGDFEAEGEVIGIDELQSARRYPLSRNPLRFGTDFQALFPPDTLNLFAANRPALPLQYRADSSIAVARIVPG
jgi:hypothetical protein